jgi:hypothetical protein
LVEAEVVAQALGENFRFLRNEEADVSNVIERVVLAF